MPRSVARQESGPPHARSIENPTLASFLSWRFLLSEPIGPSARSVSDCPRHGETRERRRRRGLLPCTCCIVGLVSRSGVAVVVLVQCAALVLVCLLIGDNGWDDGAITLAFARTFARHGRVALTPRSEVVEGFSSVSWFLINSLVALARPSYRAAIAVAQALSVLSLGACTALLARSCALLRLDRAFSALTVIAFAAWGASFSEAGNAMEMGLLATACLLMINELLSPQPRLLLLCGGVVLAVTTRFEAILYVGLLGLSVFSIPGRRAFWAMVLAAARHRRVALGLAACGLLGRPAQHLLGKAVATVRRVRLRRSIGGRLELPAFFVIPLLALVAAGRSGFNFAGALRHRRQHLAIVAAPVIGAVGMGDPARKALGLLRTHPLLCVSAGIVADVDALLALGRSWKAAFPAGSRCWIVRRRGRACRWPAFPLARWQLPSRAELSG